MASAFSSLSKNSAPKKQLLRKPVLPISPSKLTHQNCPALCFIDGRFITTLRPPGKKMELGYARLIFRGAPPHCGRTPGVPVAGIGDVWRLGLFCQRFGFGSNCAVNMGVGSMVGEQCSGEEEHGRTVASLLQVGEKAPAELYACTFRTDPKCIYTSVHRDVCMDML